MKFLLILLLMCNAAIAKDFDTTPQDIESIGIPKGYKTVIYDKRYSFAVPEKYDIKRTPAETEYMFVLSPKNKVLFGVYETPTMYLPKDFGLNITRKQLVSAFYDKTYASNKDINKVQKEIFKIATNIEVYKRNGFIFFREDRNQDPEIKTIIAIASPLNDDILTSTFSTDNEDLIMNFIKSFRVK